MGKAFKIYRPHLLVLVDIGWFAIQAGAMYYDISQDAFRPAFVDIKLWGRWRVSFEFGKISRRHEY